MENCKCILQSGARKNQPCGAKLKIGLTCGRHIKTCVRPKDGKKSPPHGRRPRRPRTRVVVPADMSPEELMHPKETRLFYEMYRNMFKHIGEAVYDQVGHFLMSDEARPHSIQVVTKALHKALRELGLNVTKEEAYNYTLDILNSSGLSEETITKDYHVYERGCTYCADFRGWLMSK